VDLLTGNEKSDSSPLNVKMDTEASEDDSPSFTEKKL
jgi:hypothetical protein